MKQLNIYFILLVTIIINASCASTEKFATKEQVSSVDKKVTDLSNHVSDLSTQVYTFNQKYSDILNENKSLREKLQDKIPIVSTKSNGFLFEAMKAQLDGSDLTIEILITNKNDKDINTFMGNGTINVIDDFGNTYKVNTCNFLNTTQKLYTEIPIKCTISIENFNKKAKYIAVIGLDLYESDNGSHVYPSLKNLKISN